MIAALGTADEVLMSLAASVLEHRHLTFDEMATVELAMERERIRHEWRVKDEAEGQAKVIQLNGRRSASC